MLASTIEKQLKTIGMNSYEVKILTALLSRGVSTAGELSDIANVPRSRSYDVLESLEKKGFAVVKSRKPIKYATVSPQEIIKRAKKNVESNAKEKIKKLGKLKSTNTIEELNKLHAQGIEIIKSTDLSGTLKGRHNLYNHLEHILKGADKNVVISTTPTEFVNLVKTLKPALGMLKKKNINVKILTQINTQNKKYVDEIRKFAEIKHTDNKARFCIVDGKEIIFMILDDNEVHPTYDVGIWVNTPLAKDLERIHLNNYCN